MSSRMRVTKGHSGNRRAHHNLKAIRMSVCSNCSEKHERHKLCLACGFYKGKQILENKKDLIVQTEKSKNLSEKEATKNEKETKKTKKTKETKTEIKK